MKHIWFFLLLLPGMLFADPELLWKRALGGRISGWQAEGPGGNLYILSEDRALHAIDSPTGTDLWRYRPGGRLVEFLAVSPDGLVYVQNEHGEIDAVNPEGQALWRCSLGDLSVLLPLVSPEGSLILLMEQGDLTSISRRGEILWRTRLDGAPSASAVMDIYGTIFVPYRGGGIGAFSGDGNYQYNINSPELNELILDSSGILYGVTKEGRVFAWQKGDELWNSGTEPGEYSSLLLYDSQLFMILKDGLIYQINQSGAEGYFQGPQPAHPSIITKSGKILTAGKDQTLWIWDIESRESEVMELPSQPTVPLLTSRGHLILGGDDWKLYCYSVEPPREGWAQYRGNAFRNGTLFSVMSPRSRLEIYSRDPLYRQFRYLLETEDPENQQMILDKISSIESLHELNRTIPFWDISLLELAGNGINPMVLRDGAAVQTSPVVRAEAYRLLGQRQAGYLAHSIISSLRSEKDPLVLAEGYLALGAIGADWDGQSVSIIDRTLMSTGNPTERQIIAAAQAYLDMLDWGGENQSHRALSALLRLLELPMNTELLMTLNRMIEERLSF